MKKQILLTGASGFVGQRYVEMNSDYYEIVPCSLRKKKVSEIDFSNIDAVVHLAGIAHQMQKIDDQIYYDINHKLTLELAKRAKEKGTKHFLYMSTIKVFGENFDEKVLTEKADCNPEDPYGKSKLLAEKELKSIETDSFKVGIVRPPLVYGPRVKGNMIRLIQLAEKPVPLPFGDISNNRTMVFVDNLVLLCNRVTDTFASGVFLASDKKPVSTTKLIATIKSELSNNVSDFQIPNPLVSLLGKIKPGLKNRLFGSLQLNTELTNKQLNFEPKYSFEEGIKSMVDWYKSQNKK